MIFFTLLILFLGSHTAQLHAWSPWNAIKSASNSVWNAGKSAKNAVVDAGKSAGNTVVNAGKSAEKAIETAAYVALKTGKSAGNALANASAQALKGIPACCPAYPAQNPLAVPTIPVNSQDNIDRLILNYSPVVYLYTNEEYLPLTFESYTKNNNLQVKYKCSHRDSTAGATKILPNTNYPTITMAALADQTNYVDTTGKPLADPGNCLFMEGPACCDRGENPDTYYKTPDGRIFKNKENNEIRTPYYAIFSEQGDHVYIQYFFLYGYNGPYAFLPGQIFESVLSAGMHKMDLEHLTLQFDRKSFEENRPRLMRIGFFSHGSGEGKWLHAHNRDLEFQGTTHVVAYSAYHGHGMYPMAGTQVRIGTFGNDCTTKGTRWVPGGIVRFELPTNSNFNPNTMGWVTFPGDFGPQGVGGIPEKDYTGDVSKEDGGQDYTKHFCKESSIPGKQKACELFLLSHQTFFVPKELRAMYPSDTLFNDTHLPAANIKTRLGTTFKFTNAHSPISTPQNVGYQKAGHQGLRDTLTKIEIDDGSAQIVKQDNGTGILNWTVTFDTKGLVYLIFSGKDHEVKNSTVWVE